MNEIYELSKFIKYEESDGQDRIFISYHSKSYSHVCRIAAFLENNDVKTWYAPRNIELGSDWAEKLDIAVENCKLLLLLYTEDADKSKHVIREVSIADLSNKPILWLKLDESSPSKALKYYLSEIQTIEWKGNEEQIQNILLNVLKRKNITSDTLRETIGIRSYAATSDLEVKQWSKGIYAFASPWEAGECVARVYFSQAQKNPNSTLLLPTGRSAKDIFYGMIRIANEYDDCPFGEAKIMNDTETYGVLPTHATSRIKTINDYLMVPLANMGKAPKNENLTYFMGVSFNEEEPEQTAKNSIDKYPISITGVSMSPYCEVIGYDLDLHSNGIINDSPRSITIKNETRDYIDSKQKTNSIYTVGMKTLLDSDLLLILAFDKRKANAIERLLKEEIDPALPLTLLRKHKNAYIIITNEVAKNAGIEEYVISNKSAKEAAECIVNQLY